VVVVVVVVVVAPREGKAKQIAVAVTPPSPPLLKARQTSFSMNCEPSQFCHHEWHMQSNKKEPGAQVASTKSPSNIPDLCVSKLVQEVFFDAAPHTA
jgi:hypothetical protein